MKDIADIASKHTEYKPSHEDIIFGIYDQRRRKSAA